MRLLLDTHALLWWLTDDPRLSRIARALLADADNQVHASAASAWEITTKARIGKLPGAQSLAGDIATAIADEGFHELPITVRHGQLAGNLPAPHRDPFDRMLIAQAIIEQMPLVSNEPLFDRYGVRRLW